jgi:hypothetical protein
MHLHVGELSHVSLLWEEDIHSDLLGSLKLEIVIDACHGEGTVEQLLGDKKESGDGDAKFAVAE